MSQYLETFPVDTPPGIVELIKQKRAVKPVVKAAGFKVEFSLNKSFAP
jgi:hypothetical protein